MLIHVSCKTAYKVVHMRAHLDTSYCLISSTKIRLESYDDESDLPNQEDLWMSDEEPTDFVFQDVIPRLNQSQSTLKMIFIIANVSASN